MATRPADSSGAAAAPCPVPPLAPACGCEAGGAMVGADIGAPNAEVGAAGPGVGTARVLAGRALAAFRSVAALRPHSPAGRGAVLPPPGNVGGVGAGRRGAGRARGAP